MGENQIWKFLGKLFIYIGIFIIFPIALVYCFGNSSDTKLYSAQASYPPPIINGTTNVTYTHTLFLPNIENLVPPPNSKSYYVWYATGFYDRGCSCGMDFLTDPNQNDAIVFLQFGKPNRDSLGNYGTVLYSNTIATEYDIKTASLLFAEGFFDCNNQDHLTIGVGLNLSGGLVIDTIANLHGARWAQVITDVNTELNTLSTSINSQYYGITGQVLAVGGVNIEPGFNPYYIPQHWLDGYNNSNVTNKQALYVIASADGCPLDAPADNAQYYSNYTAANCPNTSNYLWTQENLYMITWGYPYSWPFPEIYEQTTDAHAKQWRRIAIYANIKYNQKMIFRGTLTQHEACSQNRIKYPPHSECNTLENTPAQGYISFLSLIINDNRISNQLRWSSDIMYSGGY